MALLIACSPGYDRIDFAVANADPSPKKLIRERGTYLYNPLEDLMQ